MRKIHINGNEWTYNIGNRFAIIKSDSGKRVNVELVKIKNLSQEAIDAGRGVALCELCSGACVQDLDDGLPQKQKNGMVTPSEIKKYILSNINLWA